MTAPSDFVFTCLIGSFALFWNWQSLFLPFGEIYSGPKHFSPGWKCSLGMLRISQAKRSFRASRMPSASLPAGPKENASFATIKLPHAPKRSDERWIFWVCYNGTGITMLSKTLCCKRISKNFLVFPALLSSATILQATFGALAGKHNWANQKSEFSESKPIWIQVAFVVRHRHEICWLLWAPPFLCIASCNVYNQKSDFRSGAGHGILRFFTVHRSHPFLCRFLFSMFLLCLYSIRFW